MLKMFGGLAIVHHDGTLADVRMQRRHLAVLAVLATDGTCVTREKILGLFWRDRDQRAARHLLDQAIYRSRVELGGGVILESHGSLCLNSGVLASDVGSFKQAIRRGDLAAAVREYAGSFLEAIPTDTEPCFGHWVDARRVALAAAHIDALTALAHASIARGDLSDGIDYLERAAAAEPLSTRVARQLMCALYAAGDRTAALVAFHRHTQQVRAELDVQPDDSVLILAEEIRQGRTCHSSPLARALGLGGAPNVMTAGRN